MRFSKKGLPRDWAIEGKARPIMPAFGLLKPTDSKLAAMKTCEGTFKPPTVTVSAETIPDAPELSAYVTFALGHRVPCQYACGLTEIGRLT